MYTSNHILSDWKALEMFSRTLLGSSGPIVSPVLFRLMLTWCVGTPKDPTCAHTIRNGTIPLLSLLLAPFTQWSTALDQSAKVSPVAFLGNTDWYSSHTLSLLSPPLSSLPRVCHLSFLSPHPPPPTFLSIFLIHPSRSCFLSVSLFAMVTAFPLDNRKPRLAVCSARLWQSCQFTCLDCRVLYPVSTTLCNYNPCISKCTWYKAVHDLYHVHTFLKCFIWHGFTPNKQSLFKCKRIHYLPLVIEYPCERGVRISCSEFMAIIWVPMCHILRPTCGCAENIQGWSRIYDSCLFAKTMITSLKQPRLKILVSLL